MPRVSAFLPEVIQQIHSLRASGVVSFHVASALGCASSALRTSAGSVCMVPTAILDISFYHHNPARPTLFMDARVNGPKYPDAGVIPCAF